MPRPERSAGASSVWIVRPSVWSVCPSVRLSVCPPVRNSVPLKFKVQYLKFGWSYSNQTWTVSSSKGCSHITFSLCQHVGGNLCLDYMPFNYERVVVEVIYWHHMPLGVGPGQNLELCCRCLHPCLTNTCPVLSVLFVYAELSNVLISASGRL